MAAHQTPPSLGFSRQEHWSGLPFPSLMHESEKWKWSHSVVSDSSWPHGLQPTRLLHPGDFPGKSTGVGCHCLLPIALHHLAINCHWQDQLPLFMMFLPLKNSISCSQPRSLLIGCSYPRTFSQPLKTVFLKLPTVIDQIFWFFIFLIFSSPQTNTFVMLN